MPIYMKIDGVDGSVSARDSFEFTGTPAVDASTPKLMEAIADGTVYPDDGAVDDLSGGEGGEEAIVFVGGYGAASYQYANETTYDPVYAHDDVIVDGRIITAENYDSAY